MLRQIVGAALGSKLAKHAPALDGATGAALGAAIPFVISRMSIPGMLVMGVGGYVAKKFLDQRAAEAEAEEYAGTIVDTPSDSSVSQ